MFPVGPCFFEMKQLLLRGFYTPNGPLQGQIMQQQAQVYPQAGRGLSTSTENTYHYSQVYYNVFGRTKGFDSFDVMIENDNGDILCDVAMWREFATWLHSYGRQISNQNRYIDKGAALNYLSSLTTLCARKWPCLHTQNKQGLTKQRISV